MALLVADCPRCKAAHITFDVKAQVLRGQKYNWQNWYEVFSVCRACHRPTIFIVGLKEYEASKIFYQENAVVNFATTLNPFFDIDGFVSLRDHSSIQPPEHIPEEIEKIFREGAACLGIGCSNAASAMFRLCVDLATIPLLPDVTSDKASQPNKNQREKLFHRLKWLFDNGYLPATMHDLADCIREDANDGVHVGNLSKEDAEDLLDFTTELLEKLFTNSKKIELAKERREARRQAK